MGVRRVVVCRTRRGGLPDSPWWFAGLTVVVCRTHRGGLPDSPRRGRAALTRQSSGSSVTVSAALAPLDDLTVTFRLRRAVGRGGGGGACTCAPRPRISS